ncbi:MAG: hypothetical protein ACREMF_05155, partial [Gemmatimonadales bacterium]
MRALLEQAGRPAAETAALLEALTHDWRSANLPAMDRAMLEYAHRLTIRPGEVGAADLARLRAADPVLKETHMR